MRNRCLTALQLIVGLWLLLGEPAIAATAQARLYRVGATPAWVNPAQPDVAARVPVDDIDNGSFYVLFDRQLRLLDDGDESYTHIAVRIATPAGVDGNSQIDMSIDPDWQRLTLHFVRILRNGRTINQLGIARISEFAQEDEREQQIYNGNWTVNVLLADVRVGDIVEYAYTLRSTPLLFANHYWDRFATSWTDPVHFQRMRVLYPRSRPLRFRLHDELQSPQQRSVGAERELVWRWHDVPAARAESDAPAWHEPWSTIELSDLPDWSSVVRLALPLYAVPAITAPELAKAIEAVRSRARSPAERLLLALRFVQDEIRYTGIEIGEGSHRPRAPEQVLQTRFGDCKDKTLLLTTMLRALGIEAMPVLVHTEEGPALGERLPTPYAFNHVIVRARIDGRDYWLDGTNSSQKGTLATLTQPSFGWGLPLQQGITALVAMPRAPATSNGWSVDATLDLRSSASKPASLAVVSRYRGDAADAMRRNLDDMSRSERESKYLNYYAALFPGIRSLGGYALHDDVERNVLEISETYAIDDPFSRTRDGRSLTLTADELEPYTHLPETRIRKAPLALAYPAQVLQQFTIMLPDKWQVEASDMRIDNPAFRYTSSSRFADHTLQLRYEYLSQRDHVDPAESPQFYRDVVQMKNDLGYRLSVATSATEAPRASWPALLLAFAAGAGTLLLWRRRA